MEEIGGEVGVQYSSHVLLSAGAAVPFGDPLPAGAVYDDGMFQRSDLKLLR